MGLQTRADIDAELQEWYKARKLASKGKSVTITTSTGTRTLTQQDVREINTVIAQLERKLAAPTGAGPHNFAVATFNHDLE